MLSQTLLQCVFVCLQGFAGLFLIILGLAIGLLVATLISYCWSLGKSFGENRHDRDGEMQ